MAKLIYTYGAMNSAKSMNLLCTKHSLEEQGKETYLILPSRDTRERKVSSRTGLSAEVDLSLLPNNSLPDIRQKYILVDECQFLSDKNVEELKNLPEDKIVFLYGLKTDFKSRLFDGVKRILELADVIKDIKSTCDFCDKKAQFHIRLDEEGKRVLDGPSILASYSYKSVCWSHYNGDI